MNKRAYSTGGMLLTGELEVLFNCCFVQHYTYLDRLGTEP